MIWLLAVPVIIFFVFKNMLFDSCFPGFSHGYGCDRNFIEWCFAIAVACFFSGLISLVPFGIAAFIGSLPERLGFKDKDYPLVALREKDGIEGRFYFLGSGAIDSTEYYFWYRRNSDGSVSGGKTGRQPGVRIYEGDYEPKMATYKTKYVNPKFNESWWEYVALDLRDEEDWLPDFYIPKGSIKEGYAL